MNSNKLDYPIIAFSHLPWSGVWQRPQQFHSRLSRRHPVLFVEGPIPTPKVRRARSEVEPVPGHPNIKVMRLSVPESRWSDGKFIDSERRRLLDEYLASSEADDFSSPVLWFYDPMAFPPHSHGLGESAVVYDCMDQLSQFRFAPPEILTRERQLLDRADVVFAGGPKLHKSKRQHNDNCFCFGCGVDVAHFGKAQSDTTPLPEDIAGMKGPKLGFFGVVDERMDYDLLSRLAACDPSWNIVVLGPAAKVDPASFPKYPNLHFLGRREYEDLPAYCRAFDVCLLPFALNEATEYINPTKALEYMATGKPIVSTAVEDVVLQFSDIVHIAYDHSQFIDACRKAVTQPDLIAIRRGLRRAENSTWDSIVEQMEGHIEDVLDATSPMAVPAA